MSWVHAEKCTQPEHRKRKGYDRNENCWTIDKGCNLIHSFNLFSSSGKRCIVTVCCFFLFKS